MGAIAAPAKAKGSHDAPAPVNPFTKAAPKKTEPFFDVTQALGASAVGLQQIDVPATGYLRHIWLYVSVSGLSAGTLAADGPFNLIDSVTLADVNGTPLVQLTGYQLFLANLFGAYTQNSDPRNLASYSVATAYAPTFALRVPVEIVQRNALGSLVNLNSAMTYKLKISLAAQATAFATSTGTASVRVQGVVESWGNPPLSDIRGVANATTPPALGVTQNWTVEVKNGVAASQQTLRLSRVGNQIRNHVLVCRSGAGARQAGFPAELSVFFDGNQRHRASLTYYMERMCELYRIAPANLPTGVIALPYTDDFDGTPGEEVGDYWMGTSGSTRLELQGVFTAAGSLEVITNDILSFAGNGGAGATLGAQA